MSEKGMERFMYVARMQKLIWGKAKSIAREYGYKDHFEVLAEALNMLENYLKEAREVRKNAQEIQDG